MLSSMASIPHPCILARATRETPSLCQKLKSASTARRIGPIPRPPDNFAKACKQIQQAPRNRARPELPTARPATSTPPHIPSKRGNRHKRAAVLPSARRAAQSTLRLARGKSPAENSRLSACGNCARNALWLATPVPADTMRLAPPNVFPSPCRSHENNNSSHAQNSRTLRRLAW